jgi:hypothetical protein
LGWANKVRRIGVRGSPGGRPTDALKECIGHMAIPNITKDDIEITLYLGSRNIIVHRTDKGKQSVLLANRYRNLPSYSRDYQRMIINDDQLLQRQ